MFETIILPVLIFIGIGAVMGLLLAVASKVFAVKVDARVEAVKGCLPGANCGGCGYSGCQGFAEAVVKGEAPTTGCTVGGAEAAVKVAAVLGVTPGEIVKMRAQVMCSGTGDHAKKKYRYHGVSDCVAASKLGGGDRICPNGCVGLGTCVAACPFDAIKVVDGVAVVDYHECQGCGVCVKACPKGIIKLIPFDSKHWVGCRSVDDGKTTRSYCDVGCISCKLCEKNCPEQAIKVENNRAILDYTRCTGCGTCVEKCPRHIIWSSHRQGKLGLVIMRTDSKS